MNTLACELALWTRKTERHEQLVVEGEEVHVTMKDRWRIVTTTAFCRGIVRSLYGIRNDVVG